MSEVARFAAAASSTDVDADDDDADDDDASPARLRHDRPPFLVAALRLRLLFGGEAAGGAASSVAALRLRVLLGRAAAGGAASSSLEMSEMAVDKPKPQHIDWLPNSTWRSAHVLSKVWHEVFGNLPLMIVEHDLAWKLWFENEQPELMPVPGVRLAPNTLAAAFVDVV